LDRQAELLAYLTSGGAIFGEASGRAPAGFDPRLLHLEAMWSFNKRLDKIRGVFPRTFALLGTAAAPLLRGFAEACPPGSIRRLDNARQFHRFLAERWHREPPEPAFARDVAACEIACAEVAAAVDDPASRRGSVGADGTATGLRRAPAAVLLRCAYDIRPIFEAGPRGAMAAARETRLAIAVPAGAARPQVFELPAGVFALLAALDDFADPAALAGLPESERLIKELLDSGLIEVRR
jgi:hypothetical protein